MSPAVTAEAAVEVGDGVGGDLIGRAAFCEENRWIWPIVASDSATTAGGPRERRAVMTYSDNFAGKVL